MAANQSPSWRRLFGRRKPRWSIAQITYFAVLFFGILFYLFLLWNIERIDLEQYQLLTATPSLLTIIEIAIRVLPLLLRHLIPIFLGGMLAFEVTANLLFYLYDLPDHGDARRLLSSLIRPGRSSRKTVNIDSQMLENQRQESAWIRNGGPGSFTIPERTVAITERDGHYYRTLGSTNLLLDSFEFIHAVLDLRDHQREEKDVRLQSQEGLEVTTDVGVSYRIRPNVMGKKYIGFPPYKEVVRNLAYDQINLPGNHVDTWERIALNQVIEVLRGIVMDIPLNVLLKKPKSDRGAHFNICSNVERVARVILKEEGIELLGVQLGHFSFHDEVTSQLIAHWRTLLESEADDRVNTFDLGERVTAREKAETKLAIGIVQAIKQAKEQGQEGVANDIVALRSVEALENVVLQSQSAELERLAEQSNGETPSPKEMLERVRCLQNMLKGFPCRDEDGN